MNENYKKLKEAILEELLGGEFEKSSIPTLFENLNLSKEALVRISKYVLEEVEWNWSA